MKKTERNNTFILSFKQNKSVQECINQIQNDSLLKEKNIIIDLTKNTNWLAKDYQQWIPVSDKFRNEYKRSFVFVIETFEEELPDELTFVPTLQEAFDIIELEEIERDLGF